VIEGGPDLGRGSAAERLHRFREEHDDFRNAVANEPRGSDVIVGALLFVPDDPTCTAGVIFFNNVGYLGMCGHGTIGLMATLAYLGRISIGVHRIETPTGVVTAELLPDGRVTVENVPSYRLAADVEVEVPGYGTVPGDVAWGGNWFFLVEKHPFRIIPLELPELMRFTAAIRHALGQHPIQLPASGEVDHIELFVPSDTPSVDSRNFVLCPGLAYDRSPCGTGTSAKLACLYATGKLGEGDAWRQESFIGSCFDASFRIEGDAVIPRITGSAFVNADSIQIFDSGDPFCMGIRF
jgi:4-hydroxyproline epimerase